MSSIFKAVEYMVDIAKSDKHGYDQTRRNSPDYDCSSLVGTALHEAGFNVLPNSWTGNLKEQLLKCGFELIPVKDKRKSGDIFLTESKHVVMCVDDNTIVHASINEKGKATSGKTGDQTGKEICIRNFYTPSYGWQYHFRHTSVNDDVKKKTNSQIAKEVIAGKWGNGVTRKEKLENAGYNNSAVQNLVNKILKEV